MLEWILSSGALILIVMTLRRLLRGRISMRLQYALWALVLVRLLVPFNLPANPISVQNIVVRAPVEEVAQVRLPVRSYDNAYEQVVQSYQDQGVAVEKLDPVELDAQVTERMKSDVTLGQVLTAIWIGGTAAVMGFILWSNHCFRRKLRRNRERLDVPWVKLPVYVSEGLGSPCIFGLIHPAIYLTPDVAGDETRLRHILEHEMTHYFHGDFIIAPLRCLALALHWFDPLVWWAVKLSRQDGELACDEATIRRLGEGERLEYGRTLIHLTCERNRPTDYILAATTMLSDKKSIKERIMMIAKKPKTAVYTLIAVLLIAALAVGCTFTSAKAPEVTEPTESREKTEQTQATEEPDEEKDALLALGYTNQELVSAPELNTLPGQGQILLDTEIGYWITDEQLEAIFKDLYRQMEALPGENAGTVITGLTDQRMSNLLPFAVYKVEYYILLDQERAIHRQEFALFHYDDQVEGNWTYMDSLTQTELNAYKTSELGDLVAAIPKGEAVARYLWNQQNPEAPVNLEWVSAQDLPQIPQDQEILTSLPAEYDDWYGDGRLRHIDESLWNDLQEGFSERLNVGAVITDMELLYADEELRVYCYKMGFYYVVDREDALRCEYYVACHYDDSYPEENRWGVALRSEYELSFIDTPELIAQYGSKEAAFANLLLD